MHIGIAVYKNVHSSAIVHFYDRFPLYRTPYRALKAAKPNVPKSQASLFWQYGWQRLAGLQKNFF
jgi:hypothetical protein